MTREHREGKIIEELQSRPQFVRMAEVFATYQQTLDDCKDNPEKLAQIKNRMRVIFDAKEPQDESARSRQRAAESNQLKDALLVLCERGEWTKQKMAELIADSPLAKVFLENWQPQKQGRREDGNVVVNEMLEYGVGKDGEELFINLIPPSIEAKNFLPRTIEGLHTIARELQGGSLRGVRTVTAISWLFDRLKKATMRLFGEGMVLEEAPNDTENIRSVQFLALSYNKQAIAEYLGTGKLPLVKKMTITKEEFIKKFAS